MQSKRGELVPIGFEVQTARPPAPALRSIAVHPVPHSLPHAVEFPLQGPEGAAQGGPEPSAAT